VAHDSLRLNELVVGTERYFIAILMDVTDLKAALDKSAALFEKGLSPMVVINTKGKVDLRLLALPTSTAYGETWLIVSDCVGVIQNYNEEAQHTFGYSKEEVRHISIQVARALWGRLCLS
jgi:PAS domain-containing protein